MYRKGFRRDRAKNSYIPRFRTTQIRITQVCIFFPSRPKRCFDRAHDCCRRCWASIDQGKWICPRRSSIARKSVTNIASRLLRISRLRRLCSTRISATLWPSECSNPQMLCGCMWMLVSIFIKPAACWRRSRTLTRRWVLTWLTLFFSAGAQAQGFGLHQLRQIPNQPYFTSFIKPSYVI